jgi:hypothetical protein
MENFVAARFELREDANFDFNQMLQAGINTGAIKLDRLYKDMLEKGLVRPPAEPGSESGNPGDGSSDPSAAAAGRGLGLTGQAQ